MRVGSPILNLDPRIWLLLAIALVFGRALAFGATSLDDDALVFANPVQRDFGLRELAGAFDPTTPRRHYGLQYTPLSDVSYALDRLAFGEDPRPYHLQGILFHAAAALALLGLARRLGASEIGAFAAAALFALHPVQVESVVWISGRRTAMAGALALAAALAWARERGGLSLGAAVLANLAKQSAIVIAPVLAIVRWPQTRRERIALGAHVAIAAAFVALGLHIARREGLIEDLPLGPGDRIRLALSSAATYAGWIVWPAAPSPFHTLTPRPLLGGVIVAAYLALTALSYRHFPAVFRGLAIAGVAIVPGIHGAGSQVVAERYLYISIAGLGLAFGGALDLLRALAPPRRVLSLLAGALVLVVSLGVASFYRTGVWRDDIALFSAAVRSEPTSVLARRYLGRGLAAADRLEEAERELRQAAGLATQLDLRGARLLPLTLIDLALVLERRGNAAEAEMALMSAVTLARERGTDAGRAEAALDAFQERRASGTRRKP